MRLRFWGRGLLGRSRVELGTMTLDGPGGLRLETRPSTWDLEAPSGGGLRATLRGRPGALAAAWTPGAGSARLEIRAEGLPAGELAAVQRDGLPLLDAGTVTGTAQLTQEDGATRFALDLESRGLRLASLAQDFPVGETFGPPSDGTLRLQGSWSPREGALRLTSGQATLEGAAITGSLTVTGIGRQAEVDLALEAARVDFARLLRTSGLLEDTPPAPGADLGWAALSLRVKGRLPEAESFTVSQRLDFTPPRRVPPAIQRLQGDFRHEAVTAGGARALIDVSPSSPDFIALGDVPPLFVRTLLLGEDAGFFGHPGIDLKELPSAVLTNWERGGAARGASTITQQLAKNLFLSRDKRLGRKLQELALALLLEATLGKQRILEIYLNVIEWGPGLYGLRPASRRYFGVEPRELGL
ncbi:MAG TPA: biosynthetic peptidoglycan transglycosylase, partial [Vicinamibacteria bacterium]|nr:biosynthetic peptidoglycan transglycosylase [Vicinamibacteria bacterium]